MKCHFRRSMIAAGAVLALLTVAPTASAFISPLQGPTVYLIHGYIDRAPDQSAVIDRVRIAADGKPPRWLLVTLYRSPGDVLLDRYLSRELISPYLVRGKREDVARLIDAPAGTEIKGTFIVYTAGVPWLLVAELDAPS